MVFGPRARIKQKEILENAQQQAKEQRQKVVENQNDSPVEPLESIAQSSQHLAEKMLTRETPEVVLRQSQNVPKEAITFWSYDVISAGQR